MRLLVPAMLILSAAPVSAQRLADARQIYVVVQSRSDRVIQFVPATSALVRSTNTEEAREAPRTGMMVYGGFMSGVMGMFLGGVTGYHLRDCSGGTEWCGVGEVLVGALAGEALLLPFGVHMGGNHSPYLAKVGLSLLVLAGGIAAAPVAPIALLAVIPGQLMATISLEKFMYSRSHPATTGAAR